MGSGSMGSMATEAGENDFSILRSRDSCLSHFHLPAMERPASTSDAHDRGDSDVVLFLSVCDRTFDICKMAVQVDTLVEHHYGLSVYRH